MYRDKRNLSKPVSVNENWTVCGCIPQQLMLRLHYTQYESTIEFSLVSPKLREQQAEIAV